MPDLGSPSWCCGYRHTDGAIQFGCRAGVFLPPSESGAPTSAAAAQDSFFWTLILRLRSISVLPEGCRNLAPIFDILMPRKLAGGLAVDDGDEEARARDATREALKQQLFEVLARMRRLAAEAVAIADRLRALSEAKSNGDDYLS